MKDNDVVSNAEKNFLLRAIAENIRMDNRKFNEHRTESIFFGMEWGSCLVLLGETRVLAQISCDTQQPKASKPNEGLLYVHVEVSPIASKQFDVKGQSDISVQVNRLLEKCLKESKCVDLEALCIVAEEKVWNIRIDLNVMSFDGNLAGCCSVAALAALAHFKHPDVTSTGDQIIIHPHSEKEPIPITLHHYPVIISFALCDEGKRILTDPTALEEHVASSLLMLSVNSYHEMCGMHLEGTPLPSADVVIQCTRKAVCLAESKVKRIREALAEDQRKRSGKDFFGLCESLNLNHILASAQKHMKIRITSENPWKKILEEGAASAAVKTESDEESEEKMDTDIAGASCNKHDYSITNVAPGTAELRGINDDRDDRDDSESVKSFDSHDSDDIQIVPQNTEEIQLSGDSDASEEDEVVVLQSTFK